MAGASASRVRQSVQPLMSGQIHAERERGETAEAEAECGGARRQHRDFQPGAQRGHAGHPGLDDADAEQRDEREAPESARAGSTRPIRNGSSGMSAATPKATAMTKASRTGVPSRCGATPSSKSLSVLSIRSGGGRSPDHLDASARGIPRPTSAAISSAISSPG